MLDKNALQQLSQLKTQIIDSKDQGDGEVRGSQRRFGFVRLDDGSRCLSCSRRYAAGFPRRPSTHKRSH